MSARRHFLNLSFSYKKFPSGFSSKVQLKDHLNFLFAEFPRAGTASGEIPRLRIGSE